MTFKDAANERCNQTGMPGRVVHLSNLCTEIIEVSSDNETAVCNLGSVNLGRLVSERRVRLRAPGRDRAHGGAVPRPGHRHQLLPDPRTAAVQRLLAARRPRGHGPPGRVLPAWACLSTAPRRAESVSAIAEEIYFHALWASTELAETQRPAPRVPRDTRRPAGKLQFDLWGAEPLRPRPLGAATRPHRPVRPAQFAPGRHRPDRHHRLDRRLPTSASSPRCPTCSSARRSRASSSRSTPTWCVTYNASGCGTRRCRPRIKPADGSVQGIDQIPPDK